MKKFQFERLNTHSLAEGKFDKAIVPLGSCESRGDHLPFGTDAIIAHKLALEVSNDTNNREIPQSLIHWGIKKTWNFEELTNYGATGARSKATLEKGEKMRDVLVDCLVGFLKRMDERNWTIRTREG